MMRYLITNIIFFTFGCSDINDHYLHSKIAETRSDKCSPTFDCPVKHVTDTVGNFGISEGIDCAPFIVDYDIYPCDREVSITNISWYIYKEINDSCEVSDLINSINQLTLTNDPELRLLLNHASARIVKESLLKYLRRNNVAGIYSCDSGNTIKTLSIYYAGCQAICYLNGPSKSTYMTNCGSSCCISRGNICLINDGYIILPPGDGLIEKVGGCIDFDKACIPPKKYNNSAVSVGIRSCEFSCDGLGL